jgi:pimeloyl-ACP methyl ester carboxylesterase
MVCADKNLRMTTRSLRALSLGMALDSRLAAWAERNGTSPHSARALGPTIAGLRACNVDTPVGPVRVIDTESDKPCVVIVPDGPNVIEHYAALIAHLSSELRVVCFDMPGFGFSLPRSDYTHSLDQGVSALCGALDALDVSSATLAFSCVNGLYALRAVRVAPTRVRSLFLSQTPSLRDMLAWSRRVVPAPLHLPLIGQTAVWLSRKKLAMRWYDMALPRSTDREPFRATARAALSAGAAFSLAGVVQGLAAAPPALVENVSVPCTVLWGMQDRTHRKTDPESLRGCVPNARFIRREELGHFPDLEDPARFAQLLLAHVAASR